VTGNGCHNQNTGDGINVTGDGTTNADFNSLTGNVCTGNGSNGIEIVGGVNANCNLVEDNQLMGNTSLMLCDGGTNSNITWDVYPGMDIQEALTQGAGKEVIIHAGTHEPANPAAPGVALTVSANTMVRGEGFGSIIQGAAGATNITQLMQLNGNNIHIKDLKMILAAGCGTAGAYPNVLYATAVQQLWLENLWLVGDTSVADDGSDARQCGVYFTNVDDSKIMGCRVEDCDRSDINLSTGSDNNTVSGNTVQGGGFYGIQLSASGNNTLTGNRCDDNGQGIYLTAAADYNTLTGNNCTGSTQNGITLDASDNNTLTGNTCQGNTWHGIYLYSASDNNTLTGNTCQGNSQYGIGLDDSDNSTITGNTCQGNTRDGINIGGGSVNNTITGNTCVGNDAAGTTYHGISISASNENTITGNQCSGNGLHGIYIYRSSNCTVTGNGCHNQNTGDGINVTGDGTTNADFNSLTGNVCTGNASNGIEVVGAGDANENIVVANNLKNNTGAGLADAGLLTQLGHNIV